MRTAKNTKPTLIEIINYWHDQKKKNIGRLNMQFVAEEHFLGMMFFAFISPFLGLPFVGYIVESKTWAERIKMAFSSAFGYLIGSIIVILFIL